MNYMGSACFAGWWVMYELIQSTDVYIPCWGPLFAEVCCWCTTCCVLCHETLKTRNFRLSKVLEIRKFDFRQILLFETNNNRLIHFIFELNVHGIIVIAHNDDGP